MPGSTGRVPHVLGAPCLGVLCVLKQKWERILLNELLSCCGRTLEGEQSRLMLACILWCIVLWLERQHSRKSLWMETWDDAVGGLHLSGLENKDDECWGSALFLFSCFHCMQEPCSGDSATHIQGFLPQFVHSEPLLKHTQKVGLNLLGGSNTVNLTIKINLHAYFIYLYLTPL